ncbi:putative Eukaryotic translation initiation factor 4E [Leptomonas pyrrhocoris]|uniref:Putative Eukaryotic translation initiation factor 4E n=1 Tax=Leptomonas pyrrhocoris TaxID=157538 RepID=A0A0N0DXN7_LEPPY|nr:putative Eukaryotic translation initiation factor 4E [Leptomonas pyrrhocoris]KPA83022.1 putative Eukaryotic translation initiation factor 4E [Leptomonas pyrrhocoris]|eukprot:XP_015661461.1 putative Eukaryotic translation initiation factor 4E [Leptomonas pyrrhocoris]
MDPLKADAPTYVPSSMMMKMAAAARRQAQAQAQAQIIPTPPPVQPVPAASPQPPPVQSAAKSKISVTRTGANTTSPMPSSNMMATHPVSAGAADKAMDGPMLYPPPSPAAVPSSDRSPAVLARSVPARMSPFIAPHHIMNPDAADFVPGRRNTADGGLEALPTSTADMELTKAPAAGKQTPPATLRRSGQTSPHIQPVRLDAKSAQEIAEISQRSGLNVTAVAYVPQRTLARVVLAKPSPLTLIPSEDPAKDSIEMMLDDLWCLFYLPSTWGENIKQEDYDPMLVFRVDSIPTFWKVLNNIPAPSELGLSTLYLFRDGIDPKWEDASNRDGGIVKVKVTLAQVDEAWELLLCRTIGDSWCPSVRETVNGVALKVRERAYYLELWVTKDSVELQRDLAALWQPILGASFATTYLTHAVMQERSVAAAAAAAEKQKKNRRRH